MKGKHVWGAALAVYCLCFVLRVVEYFCIRTDATVIGEAFIHKVLGIIVLFAAAKLPEEMKRPGGNHCQARERVLF